MLRALQRSAAVPGLAVLLAAQAPVPEPWTLAPAGADSPAGQAEHLARAALARGAREEALGHLRAALAHAPFAPELLRLQVEATADPAARALACHALARVLRLDKVDKADKALLGAAGDQALALASAKAAAIGELTKFVQGLKPGSGSNLGTPVLADLAQELAFLLGRDMPGAWSSAAPALQEARKRLDPDQRLVLQELKLAMERALIAPVESRPDGKPPRTGPDPLDTALRAARCLTGLAAQAGFDDLEGPPPPDLEDYAAAGRSGRERARQRVQAQLGPPRTVAELEQLSAEERQQFTRTHAHWSHPAQAVSPNGRYRIETICGFETLLGVAKSIEKHHARLAAWYGKDPFLEQQGFVRVVPEHDDLEAEGAPFWWAGGFQSGPLTHVVFQWGTIPGLGRTLVHELTHRFDGALVPFLPAWAAEGRAVWTAQAYANTDEAQFTPRRLDAGTLQAAFVKGYGGVANLEKLIRGKLADYRDNYTAGYALWCYLAMWEEGRAPLFAEQLRRWLEKLRAGQKDPLAHFLTWFADGKQGRPKDLAEFAAGFHRFLEGGYQKCWGQHVAWMEGYVLGFPKVEGGGLVTDEPTWTWARNRAEPHFGQQHAAHAARLLADLGRREAAAAAFLWARETDALPASDREHLARLLGELGRPAAAFALRVETAQRFPGALPLPASPLPALLPKTHALLELGNGMADAEQQQGRPGAAAALRAEVHELARRLGAAAGAPAPWTAPEMPLAGFGLVEDGLTGYEERRHPGLWFETPQGDLHVGRERPKDATGLLDRAAHQRQAFVRSKECFSGAYRLSTRLHFTTSFASGCFVLGDERRDRNVRVHFSAGDFLYAVGKKEDQNKTDRVQLSVAGQWGREGHLPGAATSAEHRFAVPVHSFELAIEVVGATLVVFVDQQPVLRYATPDGSAIAGAIGVAMGQGAVRLQTPRVQRTLAADLRAVGLDLAAAGGPAIPACLGRRVEGLAVAAPGTLLLLIPQQPDAEAVVDFFAALVGPIAKPIRDPERFPQRFVVAVPAVADAKVRTGILGQMRQLGIPGEVIRHARTDLPADQPWLLFVDGFGVARAARALEPGLGLAGTVADWARRWRPRR